MGVKGANVMRYIKRLAEWNVFVPVEKPSISYTFAQFITMKIF